MPSDGEFFNIDDASQGMTLELAPGMSTRVFVGDNVMLSIVTFAPNAQGAIHSHPEEQWGLVMSGNGVRVQGEKEVTVKVGDFWCTPGGVQHTFRAGPSGARLLDVFSPPRKEYREAGRGFASL